MPVAFGAIAVPITTLAGVTGLSVEDLGAMVGRQTPVLAVFVPLALVFIVDGRRGLRQTWPPALVCGVSFAVFQYLSSNFWSVPLADIVAALASALAVLAFTRVWHAAEPYQEGDAGQARPDAGVGPGAGSADRPGVSGGSGSEDAGEPAPARAVAVAARPLRDAPLDVFRAYAPYLAVIVVFVLATRVPAITGKAPAGPGESGTGLEAVTQIVTWPGLHITTANGDPVATTFRLNYLSAAGTLLLVAGLISTVLLGIGPRRALRAYGHTLNQLKFTVLTVMLGAGSRLPHERVRSDRHAGPVGGRRRRCLRLPLADPRLAGGRRHRIRHLVQLAVRRPADHRRPSGGPVTRPDGRGELLRGRARQDDLPAEPGHRRGRRRLQGREGILFRRVVVWSVVFMLFMCALVYLQSTPVLDWMVVDTPAGGR